MPAPLQWFTQRDLETALTTEKVRELLADKGKSEVPPDRMALVLDNATGFVRGKIQIANKLKSIDQLWDTVWDSNQKAELRRLCQGAAVYYAHFVGQKAEECPQSAVDELDRIAERCKEIGEHYSTIGADPEAASSTQHDLTYGPGAGSTQRGQPRNGWSNF
mgnify:CR=1 FL=1